jgi:hypothetical protein
MKEEIVMMIDIETLSLNLNAHITQVGYATAHLPTRKYLTTPCNLWISPIGQEKADRNFETIRWWMKQKPETIQHVLFPHPRQKLHTVPELGNVLKYEYDFWVQRDKEMTIWASPSNFDFPVLAYATQGRPWPYFQERCLMSLAKCLDPNSELKPQKPELEHDAASDVAEQMEYLFRLYDKLHPRKEDGNGNV